MTRDKSIQPVRRSTPAQYSRESMATIPSMRRMMRHLDDMFFEMSSMLPDVSENFTSEVSESDDHYLISMDVPGIASDDINIEVMGNQLKITGMRDDETIEEGEGASYRERSFGQVSQTFTLPEDIDASDVEAEIQNGVLEIAIPKAQQQRRQKIEVKEGKGGLFKRMKEKIADRLPESKKKSHEKEKKSA